MPQSSNIYSDTARDVINLRRQLAALLAPPRPTSTPFLDYQQGQDQDQNQETQRTESELSRKRAMNQMPTDYDVWNSGGGRAYLLTHPIFRNLLQSVRDSGFEVGTYQPPAQPMTTTESLMSNPWARQLDTSFRQTEEERRQADYGNMVPSYQTFQDNYIREQGWDMVLPDMYDPDRDQKLQYIQDKLDKIYQEYVIRYGQGNQIKSGVSFLANLAGLPTVSKLLNPEKPQVKWYDPFFDVGTIASLGSGSLVSRAGNAAYAIGGIGNAIDNPTPFNIVTAAIPTGIAGIQGKQLARDVVNAGRYAGNYAKDISQATKQILTPASTFKTAGAAAEATELNLSGDQDRMIAIIEEFKKSHSALPVDSKFTPEELDQVLGSLKANKFIREKTNISGLTGLARESQVKVIDSEIQKVQTALAKNDFVSLSFGSRNEAASYIKDLRGLSNEMKGTNKESIFKNETGVTFEKGEAAPGWPVSYRSKSPTGETTVKPAEPKWKLPPEQFTIENTRAATKRIAKLNREGIESSSLGGQEARIWYLDHLSQIPRTIDLSQPFDVQARQAFELRNAFKAEARDLMANKEAALELDISEPAKTWDYLFTKAISNNLLGDDIYRYIIKSSTRSRQLVNLNLGLVGF